MKINKFIILILFTILGLNQIYAQINDFGLWTSVAIEKNINKHFSLNLSNDFRFNENASELGTINNELGIDYKFNKKISISIYYRLSNKKLLDDSYILRHRFFFDLKAVHRFANFDFSIRLRTQQQFYNYELLAKEFSPYTSIRPKFQIKYRGFGDLRPYLSYEFFLPLYRPERRLLDEHRFALGVGYKINLRNTIGIFSIFDKEFAKKKTYVNYIFGIEYKFNF